MDWQAFFAVILSSSVVSTLVSQLFKIWEKASEKDSGEQQALRLIMKDRLRFLCLQYISQNWIYEDELEDLIAMHNCYHNSLNGNGYLDDLMERVKRLEKRGVGV